MLVGPAFITCAIGEKQVELVTAGIYHVAIALSYPPVGGTFGNGYQAYRVEVRTAATVTLLTDDLRYDSFEFTGFGLMLCKSKEFTQRNETCTAVSAAETTPSQ